MLVSAVAYTCLHFDRFARTRKLLALPLSLMGLILLVSSQAVAGEASATKGSGFLLSQSYYVDQSRTADFKAVVGADFKSFEGSLSKGFINGSVWLKLRIAATPLKESLVIIVEPPFLQRLELYDPTQPGFSADKPVISGREQRSAVGSFNGIENGFVIPGSGTERDIFIHVVSPTTTLAHVSILTQDQALNENTATLIILGIYVALLMMFAIWGCVSLIVKRESIYGYFSLRQLASIAHVFVFFGFLRIFFADSLSLESRETIYGLVIVTSYTFSGLFDLKIISQHNPSKILRIIFAAILCFPAVSVALVFQGSTGEALYLNQLALNVCVVMLFALAMSVRAVTDSPLESLAVWVIRIGYLITTITVLLPVLMYLNALPGHVPSIKLIFLHAVVSSIVMLTLLMIQNRQRDLSLQEAKLQVKVKDVELKIENKKREDKERFLSMIIHELRNPLSVVRLLTDKSSQKGQSVHEAVMDMAKVIERVELSEKLSGGELVIEPVPVDVMQVIRKLLADRQARDRWALNGRHSHVVEVDQHLFKGIMTNLFDNAEKYSSKGSLLSVNVRQTDGRQPQLLLEVSNKVSEVNLPDPRRIFERYYRSKGAHRTPGSGLGLFLVRGWVETMGGQIECSLSGDRERGRVFTMILRFPA